MRAMQKTDQIGSAAGFIIVGVILASLLIGSVYFIKQRAEQARQDQAIAAYDKEQAAKKADESKNSAKQTEGNNSATDTDVKTATSDNLPHTGPESSYVEVIGVFLLTVSIFSYLSSKRYIPRYL